MKNGFNISRKKEIGNRIKETTDEHLIKQIYLKVTNVWSSPAWRDLRWAWIFYLKKERFIMELTDLLPLEKWKELEKEITRRSGLDANIFNINKNIVL